MAERCDLPKLNTTPGDPAVPVVPVSPPDGSLQPPQPPTGPTYLGWDELCYEISRVGGLQPQLLAGLFMNILADHFSAPQRIWEATLRQHLWNADPLKSQLKIAPISLFTRNQSIEPLSIVIKPGTLTPKRIGINDAGEDDGVEGAMHVRSITGSHTFLAAGGVGASANLLAWEVFQTWESLSRRLRETFFDDFQTSEVGEPVIASEFGNTIVYPVSVSYAFTYALQTVPVLPHVKKLDFNQTLT